MSRLVILGGGESGVGAAILGKQKGFEVFLSDRGELKAKYKDALSHYGIAFEEGKHSEELILNADEVVKSPGIPDKVALVQALKEKGIPIVSEIEFAARYTNAKLIAITGTNGKTTTTLLTHHILKNAGFNVGLAGNIGESFAWQVAEKDFDWYVLEISSFQLDGCFDFKPFIAILTNITEDHLDRYDYQMQRYIDSKFRIIQNQDENDHFIFWEDDPIIQKAIEQRQLNMHKHPYSLKHPVENRAWLEKEEIKIKINAKTVEMSIHDLALQGKHNISNSMAGGIAAKIIEIRKEVIRDSLSDFQNVEHRLEFVTSVSGVEYINDSKATNVNSTWYALESMQNPTVWIVGGVDKGNDYTMLTDLVKDKVKTIICLGKDTAKIHKAFDGMVEEIIDTETMQEAVYMAYRSAKKEDAVLLSPACASFDLFENYEDRGRQFKECVRSL